ncbi:hypothetical protein Hdeb2414_s0002g00061671 [Helianthus debilis subsp. tardiflorus]
MGKFALEFLHLGILRRYRCVIGGDSKSGNCRVWLHLCCNRFCGHPKLLVHHLYSTFDHHITRSGITV